MIDLSGKHILIMGGSRGIGAELARMAAQAGANISINYLSNSSAAESVAKDIEAMGRKAQLMQGDIAADDVAKQVVADAVAGLGEINGLAVTAGIFQPGPIDEMTPAFWDHTMNVNMRGTFLSVQAATPSLRNSKGGSIVIFTSTAGQRGSDIFSAYATSKGAQIMFMR